MKHDGKAKRIPPSLSSLLFLASALSPLLPSPRLFLFSVGWLLVGWEVHRKEWAPKGESEGRREGRRPAASSIVRGEKEVPPRPSAVRNNGNAVIGLIALPSHSFA